MPYLFSKGCLYYKSSFINELANKWIKRLDIENLNKLLLKRQERDGDDFHITVLSSSESFQKQQILQKKFDLDLDELNKNETIGIFPIIYDFGIGYIKNSSDICYFIIVHSNIFDELVKPLKKSYHITLGFTHDIHTHIKDISTLINTPPYVNQTDLRNILLNSITNKIILPVDLITFLLTYLSDINEQHLYELSILYQNKNNILRIIIDKMISSKMICGYYFYTKVMLFDKYSMEEIRSYLINNIVDRSLVELPTHEYHKQLISLLNYHSINILIKFHYEYVLDSKDIYRYKEKLELPRNFSWITSSICASSVPNKKQYIELFINDYAITDIITINEEKLNSELLNLVPNYHFFHVVDRTAPTIEQMTEICSIIENVYAKNGKILLHCFGGVGRTAVCLICYLIWKNKINKIEALKIISCRKTMLDIIQENFINQWWIKCQEETILASNILNPIKYDVNRKKFPPLILMVGYPASGKSTFSTALANTYSNVIRCNQDELRSRSKCEEIVGKYTKPNGKYNSVLVDRCNLTKKERKEWMALAYNCTCWCIFFNTDFDECKYRITRRKDHPTVKENGGLTILRSLEGTLEEPTKDEGFDTIFIINSIEEANMLLSEWGIPLPVVDSHEIGICKFPRTMHLHNLGSATRDDLLMEKEHITKFLNKDVYVEEKIDGANLGILITKELTIKCQNRSHFVDSSYALQFEKLDKFINQNSSDLWTILEPERHILYGEWVYMKHSIPYDQLPDYFIAFDLYDTIEQKFWARERLEEKLKNTNIKLIPLICKKSFTKIDELIELTKRQSAFYNGKVEGIYIRICDNQNEWLIDRAKIVSKDFVNGLGPNTRHWSKNMMVVNKLALLQ